MVAKDILFVKVCIMSSYETFEPTTYPWGPCVFLVSFLSIVISFCSPYWLVNDGDLEEGHFLNTGKQSFDLRHTLLFYPLCITS